MKEISDIAVGFVIYNPEDNLLIRIQIATEYGCKVYVFDNSPEMSIVRKFSKGNEKVRYITNGKNLGLGLGISTVCAQAFYENSAVLLFFDQDTVFNAKTLECVESYYREHPELSATHSAIVFNSMHGTDRKSDNCFKNVSLAINSGSLFYLKNLSKMNWHNERYFVDSVDYEFCFRSKKAGFMIGEYSCTPGFDHATEQADETYQILGKEHRFRAYSFSRIVDVSRSNIKLILKALVSGEIKFSMSILRLFILYVAVQVGVRVLNFVNNRVTR